MKKRITYHEAGHAIAHLVLGMPFERVSVESKHKQGTQFENGKSVAMEYIYTDGVVLSEETLELQNDLLFAGRLDLRFALAGMAGPQAEAMVIGEVDEEAQQGAQFDMNSIVAACRIAAAPPGAPIETLQSCAMEVRIIEALADQAAELLKDNWAAVEAIANALNSRKELSYADAEKIYRAAIVS